MPTISRQPVVSAGGRPLAEDAGEIAHVERDHDPPLARGQLEQALVIPAVELAALVCRVHVVTALAQRAGDRAPGNVGVEVGDDVVVRFRHKDRGKTRFAYRIAGVLGEGAPFDTPEGDVADIEIVFQEDVQPGYLLQAEVGGDTVTWFEMGHIGPVDRRPD